MSFDYTIIATLGPASTQPEIWDAMLNAGVDSFRLNTSHLTIQQLKTWLEQLEEHFKKTAKQPRLVLDVQGSKWRLGEVKPQQLALGQAVRFVLGNLAESASEIPVPHADFFAAASSSDQQLRLNDDKCRLNVLDYGQDWLNAQVTLAGEISAHKGITYANSAFRVESLSEKDKAIFAMPIPNWQISYAISYIRDVQEMAFYRNLLPHKQLIAKIERSTALDIKALADQSDALWICRGDLSAEMGLVPMANVLEDIESKVPACNKPVILAGQVLEHMTHSNTPTRSEICMMRHVLQVGYAGFVLSDETAVGDDPAGTCKAAAMFKG